MSCSRLEVDLNMEIRLRMFCRASVFDSGWLGKKKIQQSPIKMPLWPHFRSFSAPSVHIEKMVI